MSKIRNCLKEIELSQKLGISDSYVVDLAKMRCGLAQLKYLQLFESRNSSPLFKRILALPIICQKCNVSVFCLVLLKIFDFGFPCIFHLLSVVVDFFMHKDEFYFVIVIDSDGK